MDLHLLTAVHRDATTHLLETAQSVQALRSALRGTSVAVLWHVVVDGEGEGPAQPEGADTFSTPGRQLGVALARNLALAAAGGTGWVFRLDGDDTLDVEGWEKLLLDPDLGRAAWHPTNLLTLQGERTAHWFPGRRRWRVREVEESWSSPMPFHPNNLVAQTQLVLEVGGWPGLRVNEDLLWCFTLNELEEGLALPHVTLRYRRWEKQSIADERYQADKAEAFRLIAGVVNARRARAGLPPVTPPLAAPGALYLPERS